MTVTHLCSLNNSSSNSLGGITHDVDPTGDSLANGSKWAPRHALLSLGCSSWSLSWWLCLGGIAIVGAGGGGAIGRLLIRVGFGAVQCGASLERFAMFGRSCSFT